MDITTVIAVAGLAIALLNVGASVWAWRRRRAAADCDRMRHILERLRKSVGEGKGLSFKDHGAFTGEDREAFAKLRDNVAFVVDGQLRHILTELVQAYDAAEASAIRFEVENQDRMVLAVAATHFESDHPMKRTPVIFKRAIDRLSVLERRASGLLSFG